MPAPKGASANDTHTVKTLMKAGAYAGPSLIIAYSHCLMHRIVGGMKHGLEQQKKAGQAGHWPPRYGPALTAQGKNPFQIDAKAPSLPLDENICNETRFPLPT